MAFADDDTVVTDNTSNTNPWHTVQLGHRPLARRPTPTCVPTSNFYHALCDGDDTLAPDIIIDTGAEENFADESTPGTNRQASPPSQQIIMLAATGDSCTSIVTDTFQLPFPDACLDYHVFPPFKVRHPLLSVSKA